MVAREVILPSIALLYQRQMPLPVRKQLRSDQRVAWQVPVKSPLPRVRGGQGVKNEAKEAFH